MDIIDFEQAKKDRNPEQPMFVRKPPTVEGCLHRKHYHIDPYNHTVECGECGERLEPIWVLEALLLQEEQVAAHYRALRERAEKAKAKTRTKCRHCGCMTPVNV